MLTYHETVLVTFFIFGGMVISYNDTSRHGGRLGCPFTVAGQLL